MRNVLVLILLILIVSCGSDKQFTIIGTFKGDIEDQWIYLSKFLAQEPFSDSTMVKNGRFTFKGNSDYPESYMLQNHRDSVFAYFHFYLETGKIIDGFSEENQQTAIALSLLDRLKMMKDFKDASIKTE